MVINGREDMTPDPPAEAVRQLCLRHRLTAATCGESFREGFTSDQTPDETVDEILRRAWTEAEIQ
jgi:hypothetical protein